MKIRLAIISRDIFSQVRAEVDMLLRAVNEGNMDGVDAATAQLLELTVDCRSVDLSEEDWRMFLNGIREKNPAFESRYLLPGEVCASIFPTITANDYVLELPLDEDAGEDEINV
jgi:hypothetical protein